jgi:hypothetical protein
VRTPSGRPAMTALQNLCHFIQQKNKRRRQANST